MCGVWMREAASVLLTFFLGCSSASEAGTHGSRPIASGDVVVACEAKCDADLRCRPSTDRSRCLADCRDENARVIGRGRADYLLAIADCSRGAPCDQLSRCDDQAKDAIVPTAQAESFCREYVDKARECGKTTPPCLNSFKIFTDQALASAAACSGRPCSEWTSCVDAAL